MSSFALTLFAVLLFFLPAERFIEVPLPGTPWNTWGMLTLFIVLALLIKKFLFLNFSFRRGSFYLTVLFSLLLLTVYFLSPPSLVSFFSLCFGLSFVWFFLLGASRIPTRFLAILFVGIVSLQATWGIAQFAIQRDLGFSFLGETNLSLGLPGTATFSVNSDDEAVKLFRSYGLTPHPNILGGLLSLGSLVSFFCAVRDRGNTRSLWLTLSLFLFLGLCLSFSRSALLAFGLGLLTLLHRDFRNEHFMYHRFFIPLFVILLVLTPLTLQRFTDTADEAVPERLRGVNTSFDLLDEEGLVWHGVGIGVYEKALDSYVTRHELSVAPWEIAPVHSVPLLLAVEWGVLPITLLSLLGLGGIYFLRIPYLPLLALVPLLLFDHYLATTAAGFFFFLLYVATVRRLHGLPADYLATKNL